MIVYRCAWHPTTPHVLRTLDDGQPTTTYSDGMCASCADRVRAAHGLPPRERTIA